MQHPPQNRPEMRATQLGGALATALTIPVLANVATTGKPFGRDAGNPVRGHRHGEEDDKDGNHIYIDPAQWTGLKARASDPVGSTRRVQVERAGRGADLTADRRGRRDLLAGPNVPAIFPAQSPISPLRAATTAKALVDTRVAQEVNKHPTGPTLSQFGQNIKAAGRARPNAFVAPLAGGTSQSQQKTLPQNLGRALASRPPDWVSPAPSPKNRAWPKTRKT